jgi:glycosyltransferase involved in cell wall biosynthesis
MMGIWASANFVLLGYYGLRWERRRERPNVQSGHHAPASVRSASLIRFEHAPQAGLVSVIIPTHNRAHIIGRAIRSALGQTYRELEVIVADDGSSDDTRSVVESLGSRVTYALQPNAGVSAARNFGLRFARGEFIAFLDSDDAWRPWKIELQMAALQRSPDAGIAWTDMAAVDGDDRIVAARYLETMYSAYKSVDMAETLGQVTTVGALSPNAPKEFVASAVRKGDLSNAILLGNLIHTSTVLFRRSWCELTGGFDESYQHAGEDYEFYIRLSSAGPGVFIDAPSALYRIGAEDQLTAPSMILEIARNNLRAVETWLPRSGVDGGLSRREARRRFAESFAWLGQAELDAGHRIAAARWVSESLAVLPALDKRTVLLASCALPASVRDRLHTVRSAIAGS